MNADISKETCLSKCVLSFPEAGEEFWSGELVWINYNKGPIQTLMNIAYCANLNQRYKHNNDSLYCYQEGCGK